ncbi:MAG: putative NADP-dependent oxidoreductase [Amycolatopsis sp.]|uniref:NADP-dependent oxidoreductase n=1 Tax=Amycolatopsis sp. TaxID=37632 RepID=UPI002618AB30|nr:NADP-dependent oxidoreductase [Amycolatopsis sp.]MCU1684549.1 putative NADP-dependent oxidoreductase [Amycolatopsis sp.]
MTLANAQYLLAARPVGLPKPSDWEYREEPAAEAGEGQFRVQLDYLSLDPAMRSWMNAGRSYVPPVEIGEVMRAQGIGHIIDSNHPKFEVGDTVSGAFGVQRYAVSDGKGVQQIDTSLAPAPVQLGVLGISGITAYFGLMDVGKIKEGETVVVSAAAGSVGNVAGQIAKIKGCRTIGIAGGAEKCRVLVEELGFDAAIDYKAGDVRKQLRSLAPDGVDVFLDNVGGEILEAVLACLARGARVVLSGAVSQYNSAERPKGPANYMQLLVARASMTGFVVFDYVKRYPEAIAELSGWIGSGQLKSREHVVEGGIEKFPETLLQLFTGGNTGKLVLAL